MRQQVSQGAGSGATLMSDAEHPDIVSGHEHLNRVLGKTFRTARERDESIDFLRVKFGMCSSEIPCYGGLSDSERRVHLTRRMKQHQES